MIDVRLTAVLLAVSSPVFAETVQTERVSYGMASNFFDPLSNNLIAYKTETKYDEFEQGEDDRLKLAAMHCFGSFVIVRGITSGGGNCTLTDVNGDRVLQAWRIDHVTLGKGYGTWSFIGGTGAHEGITGRGYFLNEETARSGIVKITTTGTVTWPE
ncbi:hypothetical protein [Boseongicola aestuarii]|uniref:Allene oxide cyclase barrel-like domain-containing protein n=1 Tax=Boseongicola aestuarii TaxID=1470561 RepID=A0A238IVU3_9RHOB|nr:hypothetical protein [Boseongicola aestuarii]SMX22598.1 hypothetical protein BOA8489_00696 [Boseongicola aestuarii]